MDLFVYKKLNNLKKLNRSKNLNSPLIKIKATMSDLLSRYQRDSSEDDGVPRDRDSSYPVQMESPTPSTDEISDRLREKDGLLTFAFKAVLLLLVVLLCLLLGKVIGGSTFNSCNCFN